MKFEDLNNYSAKGHYLVPNEATDQWRELVKGLHINRAAAISSSGEVGLIALLPTVRKELVLIDHSYASLSVAMLKFLMLTELGAAETRRLLTTPAEAKALGKVVTKLLPKLPDPVRKAYVEEVNNRPNSYEGDFVNTEINRTFRDSVVHHQLTREWDKLPRRAIKHCVTKLGKVQFVHGDLGDLVERGPFDLLYLSNAISHSGRNGVPQLHQLLKAVRPGGYVTMAYSTGDRTAIAIKSLDLEVVNTVDSKNSRLYWTQSLFRVPLEKAAIAA